MRHEPMIINTAEAAFDFALSLLAFIRSTRHRTKYVEGAIEYESATSKE
jgi:hypothetical protein